MQTILITGGTGLVGKALVQLLVQKNYQVIILTRNIKNTKAEPNTSYALWDVNAGTIDLAAVTKADAIIHLAGAGVMDKKWNDDYKKEIETSRTKSAALIIDTLKNNAHKVKALISASAIGWYGEDKSAQHFFIENEAADKSFLGDVCQLWEKSVEAAEAIGIRVCKLRIGIVLSKNGGAYKEFRQPLKFGVAAILGSGKQMVSWVHIDDLCRQFLFALENENMQGSYNAVAPMPVNNKTLTLCIAKAVKGSFFIPIHVPIFVLKIMMGQRSIEILKSSTVSSDKIKAAGFTYIYPSVDAAIATIEG
jgi:uncharacterized protein